MNEKFVIGAAMLLLLSIIFAGTMVSVADIPASPNKFYGDARLNGNPAEVGTVIEAYIDDESRGTVIVTDAGEYGDNFDYLEVDGCSSDDGKTITFTVAGVTAEETTIWFTKCGAHRQGILNFCEWL